MEVTQHPTQVATLFSAVLLQLVEAKAAQAARRAALEALAVAVVRQAVAKF
jgi:hypothetical protein